MPEMLPVLDDATAPLRNACLEGLGVVKECVGYVNGNRFTRATGERDREYQERLDSALGKLRDELGAFEELNGGRERIIKPYEELIRKVGGGSGGLSHEQRSAIPLRSLFVLFVFAGVLVSVAESIIGLMETINKVNGVSRGVAATNGDAGTLKTKKNRLWAPTKLGNIWSAIKAKGDERDGLLGDEVKREDDELVGVDNVTAGGDGEKCEGWYSSHFDCFSGMVKEECVVLIEFFWVQ
jgi:uncharacterized protein YjbJ (UPF0337 family)